ncbi:MAG: hypothetical protein N2441_06520 [Rhodocyclaceae bacterium]|nr:hypothetical protein [Rhodocyclaceae bacterium]
MNVDDAAVMDSGKRKIEAAMVRNGRIRGPEALLGVSPRADLELLLGVAQTHDHSESPATQRTSAALGVKWAFWRQETGWSLAMSALWEHSHIDRRVSQDRWNEKNASLMALATWVRPEGEKLHANLGLMRARLQAERSVLALWGLGYEWPLTHRWQLVAEIFGQEKSRPDRAIGMRYALGEGFKLSGALGRGNDRRFGQLGFAWEF